jgi:ketosteroid isomerase-like protein
MSQENLEIARRAYESMTVGNLSWLAEFVAPEIEVDLTRNVFNPQVIRGYEGIQQFWTTQNEVWEDFRFEVEELIDAGDEVVAVVKLVGKGRGSGVPVDQREIQVVKVRDGRAVHIAAYRDRAEALEAVGLSEQDAQKDS